MPALEALGVADNNSPLAGANIGVSNQPTNINPANSTRSYSASAYLYPNAARQNLAVLTSALVQQINWSTVKSGGNVTATGVTFISGGAKYTVNATMEVIVSGGTVNTPQILELSGIGSSSVLSNAGITQVINLPSV